MAGSDEAGATVAGGRWAVGRVRGVPVYVGPSLLLLAGLFTWQLGAHFVERPLFVDAPVPAWLAAGTTTVLFLGCILLHEVGHAVASIDRGIEVRRITLFLLGGVTESVGEPETARDEVVIIGVGPLTSLVIAAAFGVVVRVLPDFTVAELIAGWLAWLNLGMAVFNLVPGYPLDGGRLLRAVLWLAVSSRHRATRMAARVGQVFASLLLFGAVLSQLDLTTVSGPRWLRIMLWAVSALGLWGGLIGIFLLRASLDAHRAARVRERLGRARVRDVMGTVPPTVPADLTLDDLAVRLQQRPAILWPVGRPLVGGVRLEDLDGVPRDDWRHVTVAEVAEPDVFVDADAPMDEALDRLEAARDGMLIAVRHGEPVGLLTGSRLSDAVP